METASTIECRTDGEIITGVLRHGNEYQIRILSTAAEITHFAQWLSPLIRDEWARPPWGELLYNPEGLPQHLLFDPPPSHKASLQYVLHDGERVLDDNGHPRLEYPPNYQELLDNGWKPFWSEERTIEYLLAEQSRNPKEFTLATYYDEKKDEYVGWLLTYPVDPREKGLDLYNDGVPMSSVIYMDTAGLAPERRTNRNQLRLLTDQINIMNALAAKYGAVLTRTHEKAATVNSLTSLFGFSIIGASNVDTERIYQIKPASGKSVIRPEQSHPTHNTIQLLSPSGVRHKQKEGLLPDDADPMLQNNSEQIIRPNKVKLEHSLIGILGKIIGIPQALNWKLHHSVETLFRNHGHVLNQDEIEGLNRHIKDGALTEIVNRSAREALLLGPLLTPFAHGLLAAIDPRLLALSLPYEAVPVLGGASALLRTIIYGAKNLKNLANPDVGLIHKVATIFATLPVGLDGGWTIIPLVNMMMDSKLGPSVVKMNIERVNKSIHRNIGIDVKNNIFAPIASSVSTTYNDLVKTLNNVQKVIVSAPSIKLVEMAKSLGTNLAQATRIILTKLHIL